MKTLIQNGTVVTASDTYRGDVLIEDEKVSMIGTSLSMEADRTIDAKGKYVGAASRPSKEKVRALVAAARRR